MSVRSASRSWSAKLLIGLTVNLIFFGLLELSLRLWGFEYSRFPRLMLDRSISDYISWQRKHVVLQHFVPHPLRMWTAEPGFGNVNALGYQGKPLPLERDPRRKRILFLGDSCTNADPEGYPEKVIALLAQQSITAEPLVAAVGGYSTYQGLAFFRESLRFSPDVVVAYFGWNDHWFANGQPDNKFRPLTSLELWSYEWFSSLRTYELLHYLMFPPRQIDASSSFVELVEKTRVPPRYFVENIDDMITLAERTQIPIDFVSPPYGPTLSSPRNVLFPADQIPRVHLLYRDLLREVVARHPTTAHLVEFPTPEFDASLMRADGIHPNEEGYTLIAEALAKTLASQLGTSR
jgi:lysophospholipase L1-like esterase